MKRLYFLLVALAFLGLLSGQSAEAQILNRGIGEYPGVPADYKGPEMLSGGETHRNLALHRTAYASSSYDCNLTAQLLTDGIHLPSTASLDDIPRLYVSTPQGPLPKREREWTLDLTPFSKATVIGADTWLRYDFVGYAPTAQAIVISGTVAYDEALATGGYALRLDLSEDGETWQTADIHRFADRLPGQLSPWKVHSDPNKQTERGNLPVRAFTDTLCLADVPQAIRHLRVGLVMPGAAYWAITNVDVLQSTAPSERSASVDVPSRYVSRWYPNAISQSLLPAFHFSSAWMPATTDEAWCMIDLGAPASIDSVTLHWVGQPQPYRLEKSGEGRYVKIVIPATDTPYALTEVQVWGRGGLVPAATGWTVERVGEQPIPATVPGTVLASYINIGAVPEPNLEDNVAQISDAYFNAPFIYRHDLAVPTDLEAEEHLWLHFGGINWKARVYLAEQYLGQIDGAFTRAQFDIAALVRQMSRGKDLAAFAEMTLPLRVEILPCPHPGSVKEKTEVNTDFNGGILGADNPTFHASIGWDWITTVRGRNIGIWRDVWTERTGAVTISDPYVSTHLAETDGKEPVAYVTAEVIVRNHSMRPQTTTVTGTLGDLTFVRTLTLAPGDQHTVSFTPDAYPQLAIPHPHLWWPNGYGEPYLYDASFAVAGDTIRYKAGLREMTWSESDDVLKLYVNGRRFVGRGGNWGFSEHNLRYRAREYDIAVRYHRDMNFTMIRNWVGQTGDEEFYEACDRYGIMVWQDFWLANPSDGPNPTDEEMFMANAEDFALKVRRHPSLGLWCGRNEGYPTQTLDKALRRLVKDVTPGIHYIGSSADDVVSGHGPYRALPVKEYFEMTKGSERLHSERGMPCVMNPWSTQHTLRDGIDSRDLWGKHDFTQQGAQRGSTFVGLMEQQLGQPATAEEFCRWAQWINYEGYRAMYESRSRHRKGLILWMTHPCWPSMVWQTYDYYFDATGALFGARKACEPLHIQYNPATDSVEVVNYSGGDRKNLRGHIVLRRLDGGVMAKRSFKTDSPEDTTLSFALPRHDTVTGPYVLDLCLEGVSDNRYLLQPDHSLTALPRPELDVRETDGQVTVTNTGATPALLLHLQLVTDDGQPVLPTFWSDNYFHLLPGESRTVTCDYSPADARGLTPRVTVTTLQ